MKKINFIYLLSLMVLVISSCTNLDEEIFSEIDADKYYVDKAAVNAAVMRSYEHAFKTGWDGDRWILQELTADQFSWTQKGRHGYDDGKWVHMHRHTWDNEHHTIRGGWEYTYQGIGLINNTLINIKKYDLTAVGVTNEEVTAFTAELRALRVWYYTFVIDYFRHIPISEDNSTIKGQSTPQEVFAYMEKELVEIMPFLSKTPAIGRQGKASAAFILMRMYLNAKTWTGTDRSEDCAKIAQEIIDGQYGDYKLDDVYTGPFKSFYNGQRSTENIFEWAHEAEVQDAGWLFDAFHHYKAQFSLNTLARGGWNAIHLSPSRDLEGNLYTYPLGQPFEKFHAKDLRKQHYVQTDKAGTTEGFFLFGQQYEFDSENGFGYDKSKIIEGGEEYNKKPLIFVDQVGRFSEKDISTGRWPEGSNMTTGEENTGVRLMKFGPYTLSSGNYFRNSTPEMRLAEAYYTLAECKYKKGDKAGAATLLDAVRKRNYPTAVWSSVSYVSNLSNLTDQEFIDELGREFLGERHRRTDLVRWERFGEAWWDKKKDPEGKDYSVFPIPYDALSANPLLKQTTRGWE